LGFDLGFKRVGYLQIAVKWASTIQKIRLTNRLMGQGIRRSGVVLYYIFCMEKGFRFAQILRFEGLGFSVTKSHEMDIFVS